MSLELSKVPVEGLSFSKVYNDMLTCLSCFGLVIESVSPTLEDSKIGFP